ncbi:holin-like protein [Marinobacterium mangrovicola]|uniref:Holin-like protein n=2 Tax=Marinobacterium mangrovicola TaxID=1476959 RepID=A0A4R1G8D2_9GAMM|nr:holin-like protein [Marinobacterium mangrovicola]
MPPHTPLNHRIPMARTRSLFSVVLQITAFCGLFWLCNLLVELEHLPVPAGVIGMVLLVVLLLTRLVPEKAVRSGSNFLLGELLLFFIPPVVSILKYWSMLRDDGWMLIGALIIGTVVVLTGTAWVVDRIFTLEKRMNERRMLDTVHV